VGRAGDILPGRKVFRVEAYRLVQRGPSFPMSEISFERRTGRFEARTQQTKNDEVKEASGALEMPTDLYNGMALVLLKNLQPGSGTSVQMAVFTPKPRLINMNLISEQEEVARLGGTARPVRRYLVKLEIGGLTGVLASLIGKDPPDVRYWLAVGEVPAFIRRLDPDHRSSVCQAAEAEIPEARDSGRLLCACN
jgi:hypothetical protein